MSGAPDNAKEAHREHKHPRSDYLCCSSHTGIRGNEKADQLAKEGKRSNPHHMSYREVKTLIRNKKKATFDCKTGGYNPNQDALDQLPRHQQTMIFRLRTGHCRLNSHLKTIGVKTSAQCTCGETDQTPEHYLQSCSLHQQARQQIWPTCVPQNQALGVCRGFVPDIQVCGTHGREDLVTQPSHRTKKKTTISTVSNFCL